MFLRIKWHISPSLKGPIDHPVKMHVMHTCIRTNAMCTHNNVPLHIIVVIIQPLPPHAVLDVVVDDEVQFLVGEAVVLRQNAVDFVDDWFVWGTSVG